MKGYTRKLFAIGMALLVFVSACGTPQPAASPVPPTPPSSPTVIPTPFTGAARVKLGDISMYFEVHGAGKPLILLHGGLSSADVWANQVPVFSQQYRVITLDSRGQGRTTDAEAPISYHLMAEDTLGLMNDLGIDAADIVGWSDGGNIALDLAIHHPDRVRALVAYGANITPDGIQADILKYLRDSSIADLGRDMGDEYRRLSPQPEHLPIIIEKIRTMWLTEPNFTTAELAGIKAPTLVMDGQNEEVIRSDHAKAIASAIPKAELSLLPGVGHYAVTEQSAEWNRVVLDFLKDK